MTETKYGLEYKKPKIAILEQTGIGVSEFAARTAYNSFDKSENTQVNELHNILNSELWESQDTNELAIHESISKLENVSESKLLSQLSWVNFHHSVLEHSVLSFYIKDISRGVLQELARHRIASYTVQSTRYTMGDILYAFVSSTIPNKYHHKEIDEFKHFSEFLNKQEFLIIKDKDYKELEYRSIFDKLSLQMKKTGIDEFYKLILSKDAINKKVLEKDCPVDIFNILTNSKTKRNIGDPFKHIVTDNWSVELVMSINLRSLKNFLDLRGSGAAYFQIRWLAECMKRIIPKKYLQFILKN